jgi:hypothetical protein
LKTTFRASGDRDTENRRKPQTKKETTVKSFRMLGSLCVVLVLLGTGCASIVSKSNWPITFKSDPTGAEIVITDKLGKEIQRGTTPLTITLPGSTGYFSGASYTVELKLAGYDAGKGTVSAGMNGWYFGNILFGGLIGMVFVDPATGAMFKLPEQYTVNLKKSAVTLQNKRTLNISSINDLPVELRARLIRLN